MPRVRSLKIWSACFCHGVIRASTSSVAQGYNPEISKQWKIWPVEPVRRVIRASFSQERMTYIKEESKVSYQSKDGEIIESPKNL